MKRKTIWTALRWAAPKTRTLLVAVCLAAWGSGFPIPANAQGLDKPQYFLYNFSFGARALGQANAFTANGSDLTTVFWNPARLADLDYPEVLLSWKSNSMTGERDAEILDSAVNPVSGLTDPETYTHKMTSELKRLDFLSAYMPAHIWEMKWGFALSRYRLLPYGADASTSGLYRFRDDPEGDSAINKSYSGSGGVDALALSAACALGDSVSLGITYQHFIQSGNGKTTWSNGNVISMTSVNQRFEGQSMIFGLSFKPSDYFWVGLSYQTAVSNRHHVSFRYETITEDAQGRQTTVTDSAAREGDYFWPARFSAGFLIKPFPTLHVSFDYFVIYWDHGRIREYSSDGQEWKYPSMTDVNSNKQGDWVNLRLGAEWRLPFAGWDLYLRGGVFHEKTLFRDDAGAVPEIVGYSLGLGADFASWLAADIAWMRQRSDWSETGVLKPAPLIPYRCTNDIFSLSLIFRFAHPDLAL